MCIIIVKPAGIKLKEEIYRECFRVNDDGAGLAYVDPATKKLVVEKGFMNMKASLEAIQPREDLDLLIHFRRVSRGERSQENCHPFIFNAWHDEKGENPRFTFALVHNGTLPFWSTAKESDTRCWVDNILAPEFDGNPYMVDRPSGRWFIKEAIGPGNKLVIMRYDNLEHKLTTTIINKDGTGGNESLGCWFSNHSWVPITGSVWNNGAFGYRQKPTHSKIQSKTPPDTKPMDGEGYADHNGWIWRASKKQFENIETHAWTDSLSYRSPMDNDYLFSGKWYRRFDPPNDTKDNKIVQTKIPNLLLVEPKDGKGSEDIQVPRDIDSSPEDSWEKDLKLSQGLAKCEMNHLNKREKRELRRCAGDWYRSQFGENEYKAASYSDMITILRHWWRDEFPTCKELSLKDLDQRIINSGGVNEKPAIKTVGHDLTQGPYGMGYVD